MTLRKALRGDTRRVHDVVERVLDSEDALIVLVNGDRTISYAAGFALSPCQLELLTLAVERTIQGFRQPEVAETVPALAADALAEGGTGR